MYIVLNSEKNSYGELRVTFYNIRTQQKHESLFSEGEHSQVEQYLLFLNEGLK
jgi:hypothetical protein